MAGSVPGFAVEKLITMIEQKIGRSLTDAERTEIRRFRGDEIALRVFLDKYRVEAEGPPKPGKAGDVFAPGVQPGTTPAPQPTAMPSGAVGSELQAAMAQAGYAQAGQQAGAKMPADNRDLFFLPVSMADVKAEWEKQKQGRAAWEAIPFVTGVPVDYEQVAAQIYAKRSVRLSDWLIGIARERDEAKTRALQASLEAAGFLGKGTYLPGFPDASTLEAAENAARGAAFRQTGLPDLLAERGRYVAAMPPDAGVDPTAEAKAAYTRGLWQSYLGLWGTPPPPGYIEKVAASGLNLSEFEYTERQKPAFANSPVYQEERMNAEYSLARALGALG